MIKFFSLLSLLGLAAAAAPASATAPVPVKIEMRWAKPLRENRTNTLVIATTARKRAVHAIRVSWGDGSTHKGGNFCSYRGHDIKPGQKVVWKINHMYSRPGKVRVSVKPSTSRCGPWGAKEVLAGAATSRSFTVQKLPQ